MTGIQDILDLIDQLSESLTLEDFRLVGLIVPIFMQIVGKSIMTWVRSLFILLYYFAITKWLKIEPKMPYEEALASWKSYGQWVHVTTYALSFALAATATAPLQAAITGVYATLFGIGVYELTKQLFSNPYEE